MCLLTAVGGRVTLSLDTHLWLGSPRWQYTTHFLIWLFFCRAHCNNQLGMHFYCVSVYLYIIRLMVETAQ